jgi:NADPH:quinone reductase
MQQYVAAKAANAFSLPPDIGFADATALLIQGLTAFFLVRDGVRLAKNESVLILAAAGGVGSIAVQLARIMGTGQVIGAASTPEKRRLVLDIGADATIDYTQQGWSAAVWRITDGRGANGALVSAGGEVFDEALGSLAPRGRLAVYGTANNELPILDFVARIDAGRLGMNQTLGFFGRHYYHAYARAELRQALDELIEHVRRGRLRLAHGQQLPPSAAADAHQLIESRQSTGKVVLLPWAD